MTEPRRPKPSHELLDDDPHDLIFGDHTDTAPESRHDRRAALREHGDRRHKRRLILVLAALAVLVVGVAAWIVVPRVVGAFTVADYAGQGDRPIEVVVAQGDTATDIAAKLLAADVVKSREAFIDAANANTASSGIQPGTYRLRTHMSGTAALRLMLDPASRCQNCDIVVTEGATIFDVEKRLTQALGSGKAAAVHQAITSVASLGVPLGYQPKSGSLTTVEGFLYPATYPVDPSASAADVLQNMTTRFAEHDRSTGFANDAKAAGLMPYQALIIASIAQSEAKFAGDMPKVVRVILNRLAADRPLQIDATTRYGATVRGVDPGTVSYNSYDSPYNSYLHDGLPPTPISNPGADALAAAVHPAAGDWMYYVNSDSAGHLFFTDDEQEFAAAVEKCRDNNWGCG